MEPQRQYWRAKDRRQLLLAAMESLAGNAYVSFEGDLHSLKLSELPGASGEETPVLKRNTIQPRQDFVVLPLEADHAKPIMAAIGGTVPKTILHVQIEKNGTLEFGLYDVKEVSPIDTPTSRQLLDQLKEKGIIQQYSD